VKLASRRCAAAPARGYAAALTAARTATIAATLMGASAAAARCDDPFASPDDMITLTLRMTRADWDLVRLGEPVGEGCDAQYPFVTAELRCDDEPRGVVVGVRKKRGEQRGQDTDQKPPLKIDINHVERGQRWPLSMGKRGLRKLTLNTGQADRPGGVLTALATEVLGWRMLAREVGVAARVAYARLDVELTDASGAAVQREPHGLYILIEELDRTGIAARFDRDRGRLLKTTDSRCRDDVVFDDGEPNETTAAFETWAALDPHAPRPAGAWRAETERVLDLETLLRQEALRDVLDNQHDTVLGNGSNVLVFDPAMGRRHYLPWDLDDVLRPQSAPHEPLSTACSFVGERTRCHPDIEPRYLEIACQLISGTLAPESLHAELEAIDLLVRPHVRDEAQTIWRAHDVFNAANPNVYGGAVAHVSAHIDARIASLRRQLEERGTSCPEFCAADYVEPCERLGCAGVRACVDGRVTECEVLERERCNGKDDDCDLAVDEDACAAPITNIPPSSAPAPAPASCSCASWRVPACCVSDGARGARSSSGT
jgi:CotH kinase protein